MICEDFRKCHGGIVSSDIAISGNGEALYPSSRAGSSRIQFAPRNFRGAKYTISDRKCAKSIPEKLYHFFGEKFLPQKWSRQE